MDFVNKNRLAILVFLIALVVRFWNLTSYPVHLSMDEVAIGYNAYSILETGRDEHGQFLPLAFRSVGDYKPPVNVYLAVPSIALFGLTEFGVRFSTAFLGALTAFLVVFLVEKLGLSRKGALFSGLVVALSPWHIHFSRASFEAVTALFFLVLGLFLFLSWQKRNTWQLLTLSGLSFGISVWAYHAERFFAPLLVLFLILLFRKKFDLKKPKVKKQAAIAGFAVLILAIPFIYLSFFTPAIRERAASTSILRDISLTQSLHNGNYETAAERILDSDIYLIFRHWAGKYLNYFDLRFWGWKGLSFTPPGYPDMGLIYLINLPILLFGFYALIKSKNETLKKVSLFWFLAGPLPASFTINEQHPLRALVWLPFFAIAIGAGFEFLIEKIRGKRIWLIYGALLIANFVYFFDIYTNQFPRFFSEFWQYGYKQISLYVCENYEKYDEILIGDTFGTVGPVNTGTPYLYLLFYCDWDRETYLNTGNHPEKLKYQRPAKEDLKKENVLLIPSYWDYLDRLEEGGSIINSMEFLNGQPAFYFVEP